MARAARRTTGRAGRNARRAGRPRDAAAGGPAPQVTGEFRLGDVRHVFAATGRAAEALGFRAQEDFGAAMAELLLGT